MMDSFGPPYRVPEIEFDYDFRPHTGCPTNPFP